MHDNDNVPIHPHDKLNSDKSFLFEIFLEARCDTSTTSEQQCIAQ